jgi:hypothetical protein
MPAPAPLQNDGNFVLGYLGIVSILLSSGSQITDFCDTGTAPGTVPGRAPGSPKLPYRHIECPGGVRAGPGACHSDRGQGPGGSKCLVGDLAGTRNLFSLGLHHALIMSFCMKLHAPYHSLSSRGGGLGAGPADQGRGEGGPGV